MLDNEFVKPYNQGCCDLEVEGMVWHEQQDEITEYNTSGELAQLGGRTGR